MAVNKPEQASTEMTKVLKSIADTIDGKSNTDCAATSEISKWTKYVGNKLAENSGSGGGSGTEIIPLVYAGGGGTGHLYDINYNIVSKSQVLEYLKDPTKLVVLNDVIVSKVFQNSNLLMASCYITQPTFIDSGIEINYIHLEYLSSNLTLSVMNVQILNGGSVTTQTTPIELS